MDDCRHSAAPHLALAAGELGGIKEAVLVGVDDVKEEAAVLARETDVVGPQLLLQQLGEGAAVHFCRLHGACSTAGMQCCVPYLSDLCKCYSLGRNF
jgi:hypothetical protein